MTFTLVIKDSVAISRLRQCTAKQQRDTVESALRTTVPISMHPRLGVMRFNTPKGTLEIPVVTKQAITEDTLKRYTTDVHTKLGTALTPVKPQRHDAAWR